MTVKPKLLYIYQNLRHSEYRKNSYMAICNHFLTIMFRVHIIESSESGISSYCIYPRAGLMQRFTLQGFHQLCLRLSMGFNERLT